MEKFEKYIKDQLSDMEVTPPAGLWHQISDKLDAPAEPEIMQISERKERKISIAMILRVAAVFLGLVSIGLHYYDKQTEAQPTAANNEAVAAPQNAVNTVNAMPEQAASAQVASKDQPGAVNNRKKEVVKQIPVATIEQVAETPATQEKIVTELPLQMAQDNKTTPASDEASSTNINSQNIPVYSLKLLNSEVPSNDEIKVINAEKSDSQKKVIIIEKNLNKKPSLDFQIPYRF